MILQVEHKLCYSYSQPVFLTPHYLYLTPRASSYQQVKTHVIEIEPSPSILIKNVDIEANRQHVSFFNEECNKLSICSTFKIETQPFNSFDFIYFPFDTESLPFKYLSSEADLLKPYFENSEEISTSVHHFARQRAAEAAWKTSAFLTHITSFIQQNFLYETRERGNAFSAEKTLLSKKGSCRDYAVLMIQCCKALGIAARFVSGYCFGSETHAHELHAWVEVYLPGGGWRGFDPTEGKSIDHTYIALAASAYPELINPVSGNYRGQANSMLETSVNIVQDEENES